MSDKHSKYFSSRELQTAGLTEASFKTVKGNSNYQSTFFKKIKVTRLNVNKNWISE